MDSKHLEPLSTNYFDRDNFILVFKDVFNDDIFDIECMCQEHTSLYTFHLYYNDDEFYIIHLTSGTIINWYKHLGRANTCNKEGFTLDALKEMLTDLKSEIQLLGK